MKKRIVAMYLRLSNEDSGKGEMEESNSISAQRVLLKRLIASQSFVMTGIPALTSAGRGCRR